MTAVNSSFSSSNDDSVASKAASLAASLAAASANVSANLCSFEIPDKYFHFGMSVQTFFILPAAGVYHTSSVTYFLE